MLGDRKLLFLSLKNILNIIYIHFNTWGDISHFQVAM